DGIRDFHVTGVQTCALPIYKGDMFGPVANKINFLSAADTPQRNHMVWFIGHNSGIIGDGTKRFEFPLCFLVQAMGIGNLGNGSYKHLGRKLKCGFERMIDLVVQFDFVENLFAMPHWKWHCRPHWSLPWSEGAMQPGTQ